MDLSKAKKLETRVIARGEITNHAHVVTGDADLYELNDQVFIKVNSEAVIKHILEKEFVESGAEIWTNEHTDIALEKGVYKFVPQIQYDPFKETIERVKD